MVTVEILLQILLVVVLSIISGLFAGLTIGLMSLDETTLQVIRNTGTETERKYAERIVPVRKDSYMLLVTLILTSTIINETIPVVAEGFSNTGWAAVLLSTVLLLVFGELLPQAICTKYGLAVGGRFIWLVRLSMMLLWPIAYPMARILENLLGKHHGIQYKRAELKELVSIMGGRIELAPDEVKIIRGVLDLRDKHPALIMTPLDQVYMLDAESILDRHMVEDIVGRGYSRIPIYVGRRDTIVGLLLVKRLLAMDLSQPIPVAQLPISGVPMVDVDQSLFTILNDFQQGRSHLAIVCSGKRRLGIVTLEDIIEEMIQEEINDESDLQSSWHLGNKTLGLDVLMASRRRALT